MSETDKIDSIIHTGGVFRDGQFQAGRALSMLRDAISQKIHADREADAARRMLVDALESLETVRRERDRFEAEAQRSKQSAAGWMDLFDDARIALIEAWDAQAPCEECDGHGGRAITQDIYTADRMEIERTDVIVYEDPMVDPCRECLGTGFETPAVEEFKRRRGVR